MKVIANSASYGVDTEAHTESASYGSMSSGMFGAWG